MTHDIGRLLMFLIMLTSMGLLEFKLPWRPMAAKFPRWVRHAGLQFLAVLLIRLSLPMTAVGVAALVQERGWGLLPILSVPGWVSCLMAFVLLDLGVYAQHVVTHHLPVLWRLHRLHHSDRVLDVTTALRFHPFEILLSMLWKMVLVLALGAPIDSVLLFEMVLSSSALFNHANIRLPAGLDHWLRYLVVTPDMHRIHHSRVGAETNSNYGFFLPWWDRVFGSYREASVQGDALVIGLQTLGELRDNTLPGMLIQPFRRDTRS